MTIEQAFDLALQHHQAGRLSEAEALYRQILAVQPNHAASIQYLGVMARQVGQNELAVRLIRQAIDLDPTDHAAYSNLGGAYRAAGRLDEAIAAYHRALELKPDLAEAHNNLGNALKNRGRLDEAIAAYQRALALVPDHVEVVDNLGNALLAQGRLEEALAAYRRVLQLQPDRAETHNNLGYILTAQGQFDEAIAVLHRALHLKPDFAEALCNLGNAHRGRGQLDEAVAATRRAIQLRPDFAEAHNDLGNAFMDRGELEEAIRAYQRAIELKPDFVKALSNLGCAFQARGLLAEAIAAASRAIQLKPDFAEPWNNLGNALRDRGQFDDAVAAFRRALELKPDFAEALVNLGTALRDVGEIDESITVLRRALVLEPNDATALNNLANALKDQGQLDEAIGTYRRALELDPDNAGWHSNLVYALHFEPRRSDQAVLEEQGRWNRQFSDPVRRCVRTHDNDRNAGRRLRVGYVSPDFWRHVICHFLTPLLEAHDHSQFEIFCYASVQRPDAVTQRLKKAADVWRNVRGVGDEALAETIRADGIDILVDLTQHMANNRLLLFARKPAPVQVSWLGYPASTGLPAMDYRITDAFLEPVDAAWSKSVETPVRLPDSWFCFDPIDEYPEPGPLPALTAGYVTFGSLNNFCKINKDVLRLWAQILQSVDGSRLLMQCPAGSTQARVRQWFEAQGIAAHRLELVSRTATREEFLQLFGRIDLALETFPYNGGTTTCEALWMGEPAPTFPGSTAVSRIGLSILSAAGLHELIAAGQEEYVRLIVSLATDLPRLAKLRSTLRQRMRTSAFMDAPRFARNIEAAYRAIWRHWCAHRAET